VKLHWANHDQYYIKTGEHFKNYTFKIDGGKTVHFRLRDANTEQNNNKAQGNQERKFKLVEEDILTIDGDELNIWFTYEPLPKGVKQEDLLKQAFEQTKDILPTNFQVGLLKKSPTEKQKNRTLLEKHLKDYTARNTFDYFIHKDLGGFLSRELDFFIKNEILNIDDIDLDANQSLDRQLRVIKAFKAVAQKIIAMLAQLEDFQKKLWLKKKFVIQSDWCITLDCVPEEFYAEIAENDAQVKEWVNLFAIDEIKDDTTTPAFSNPLSTRFLKANTYLTLDTKFFSSNFKYKLFSHYENLDQFSDGLLINSENFQGLRFLSERYRGQLRSIYIDPPYNTVHSEIAYKNQFKHSSWLSLIHNGVPIARELNKKTFSFGFAIDDYELPKLLAYIDQQFSDVDISIVVVNHHPQGSGGKLSRTHEYYIICSSKDSPDLLGEELESYQEDRSFMRSGTADNNYRSGRWKSFYALLYDPQTKMIIDSEEPIPLGNKIPLEDINGLKRIYPINSRGEERVWRSSFITGKERAINGELFLSDGGTVYQSINHESKRKVLFSNWTDSQYNAGMYGSNLINDMGIGDEFDYPKSINTMITGLWAQTFGEPDAIVLDYFAGSGTTGHAVINMNRDFQGS